MSLKPCIWLRGFPHVSKGFRCVLQEFFFLYVLYFPTFYLFSSCFQRFQFMIPKLFMVFLFMPQTKDSIKKLFPNSSLRFILSCLKVLFTLYIALV